MLSSSSCQKAKDYFISNDFDKALEYVERCLASSLRETYKKTGTEKPIQYYEAKLLEAQIYGKKKEYEKAEEIFDSVMKNLNRDDQTSNFLKAKVNYYLSQVDYQQKNIDTCLQHMYVAKDYFERADSYKEAIDLLFDIQEFPTIKNDFNKFLEVYSQIEEEIDKLKDKNDKRLLSARAKLNTAVIYKYKDIDVANDFLKSALEDFTKLKIPIYIARTLVQLAIIEEKSNLSRSEKLLDDALKELERINDETYLGITELKLGNVKLQSGQKEDALTHIENGIKRIGKIEVNQDFLDTTLNLAKTSYIHSSNQSEYERTSQIINECIIVCDEVDDKYAKAISRLLEGLNLIKSGDLAQGKNKLTLVKVLLNKLARDPSQNKSLPWVTDLISYIATYQDSNNHVLIANIKDPHPVDAEVFYISGKTIHYLDDNNANADELIKISRELFSKLSSRKNSFKEIVKMIDQEIK